MIQFIIFSIVSFCRFFSFYQNVDRIRSNISGFLTHGNSIFNDFGDIFRHVLVKKAYFENL